MSETSHSARRLAGGLALFAGLFVGGPVAASETAVEAPTSGKAANSSIQQDDPKVCKRVVPTGSRIARRYCLPKSQWDAMREDGQRAARDAFALESQYGYEASPSGS